MHETTAMIRRLSVDYTKYTKCQACRRRRCITPHLHGPSQPAQTAVRHVSYVMVHQWTSSPNRFYNVLPFYLRWALTPPSVPAALAVSGWFWLHEAFNGGHGCLSFLFSGCLRLCWLSWPACVGMSFWSCLGLCLVFAGVFSNLHGSPMKRMNHAIEYHWIAGAAVLRPEFLHMSCWFTKNWSWFKIRTHFGATDSGQLWSENHEKPWYWLAPWSQLANSPADGFPCETRFHAWGWL